MIFLHRSSLVHLIACPHAGPTLLTAQLSSRYYIFGCQQVVRSITRACVTCRHVSAKPKPPIPGQLPTARVSPDIVFVKIGIDYAGPISITYGYVAKPTIVKAYVCVFEAIELIVVVDSGEAKKLSVVVVDWDHEVCILQIYLCHPISSF